MGLAPLLGWCLDAVISTRRWQPLLPRVVNRACDRLQFVMRTGLPEHPVRGGDLIVLWIGLGAFAVGWIATQTAWIFGHSHAARFIVWTAGFFLVMGVRRRAGAGMGVLRSLLGNRPDLAREWVAHLDGKPEDDSPEGLTRATVQQLAASTIEVGLLIAFWGTIFGMGVGGAAACVHLVARYGHRSETPDDPLWAGAQRTERWLTLPVSWLAMFAMYFVIPLAGGKRAQAMAGYFNGRGQAPIRRVGIAVAEGLGLTRVQTPDGIVEPIVPEDIQRAVIVLWTTTFVGTAILSGISCLVFWIV